MMFRKGVLFILIMVLLLSLPGCGGKEESWQEQYDLGVRYLEEGNYEEAIIAFTAAIEIDSKRTEAYVGLADLYLAVGDVESAISILEQGYKITGDETLNTRRRELGVSATDEVIWTDPAFERLIRDKLALPDGPVYAQDLDEIEYLSIYGDTFVFINSEGDKDEYKIGFRYIDSDGTDDHGPWKLTAYYGTNSGETYITRGEITNIDTLRYFRNLHSFHIYANHITDISVLDQMNNLENASFWANDITDLSPLDRLPYASDDIYNTEQFIEIGDILAVEQTQNN